MGWTIYNEPRDPLAECERLCTWSNDEQVSRVLASAMVGSVFYAAVETEKKPSGDREVWAAVFLTQRSPFGYKDMCESMGPCEASPPLYVLKALSPLPPRAPTPCRNCDGTGKLPASPSIRAEYHGKPCYICDGAGETDRHDYARNWRKRAWARFGGEPQGVQLELIPA